MLLNNPIFRTLLRSIVANRYEDMQKGYHTLFSLFGKNIEKAAEYLWKNRDLPLYAPIGYDRIDKKLIMGVYDRLVEHLVKYPGTTHSTLPSMSSMLNYLQAGITEHTTKKDPRVLEKFSEHLYDKLLTKYQDKQFTSEQFYSILNIAAIEQGLEDIVKDPSKFNNAIGQTKGQGSFTSPGMPNSRLASDYQHIMSQNLRVLLKYIDSFEN